MNMPVRTAHLLALAALPLSHATAQWSSVPLRHFDPAATLEFFGASLAYDQGTLVIGAAVADGVVPRTGAAYVYVRSGNDWVQQARLVPSNGATQDSFGSSVSIRGDLLAVGSPHYQPPGNPLGRVHVFRRSGTSWTQEATIPVPVVETNPLFGTQVALVGESLLASAPNGNSTAGVVYRFERVSGSWVLAQSIVPPDPSPNMWFGQQVVVDGLRLAIGAHSSVSLEPGGVYTYDWTGASWALDAKILPPRLVADGVGSALALQGDTLLMGVGAADYYELDAGAAFFWKRGPTGWFEEATLRQCRPDPNFGSDVHLDQDTAIVTAPQEEDSGLGLGTVYVFHRESGAWVLQTKVVTPGWEDGGSFMGPTLLAGDRVFLATPQALGTGRVWEFQIAPTTYPSICVASWDNDLCAPCYDDTLLIAGSGCENSALTCGTQLVTTGVASLGSESLVLRARGMPLSATGVLFQGSAAGPGTPFGAGVQCVGGSLIRIAMRSARSGSWTYPMSGDPLLSAAGLIPGSGGVRHYQIAYRDLYGYCGDRHSNMTNGVSVTWTP